MYKIKGKDSNGNKFKIKPIMGDDNKYMYRLSYINPDGTRSYKLYKSLYDVLCNGMDDTTKCNIITLKIKIKGWDKRIKVVADTTDGKSSLIRYSTFIDGITSYLCYDIIGLAIRLENLIPLIEEGCEKPTSGLTQKPIGNRVQYYPIPENLRGGYGVGVAVYELR